MIEKLGPEDFAQGGHEAEAEHDYLSDLSELGMNRDRIIEVFGTEERKVRRWLKGDTIIPEAARALIWTMRYHDPSLMRALQTEFTPGERGMPETMDRLMWAMSRDRRLADVLLTVWVDEDGDTTPLMDLALLAIRDKHSRAKRIRTLEIPT